MLKYIARRLVIMIPELLIISFLVFIIMQAAPGNFLDMYRLDPSVSQQFLEKMEKNLAWTGPGSFSTGYG